MGGLSVLHNRMHFGIAGDAEWNSARWLLYHLHGSRVFLFLPCIVCCCRPYTICRPNTWNPKCTIGSSWKKWVSVKGCMTTEHHWSQLYDHAHTSHLLSYQLLRRLWPFVHLQCWQGRGWQEVSLVSAVKKSNLGTIHLFTLREGSTPVALQVSPILSSPWLMACLHKWQVSTGSHCTLCARYWCNHSCAWFMLYGGT